jgi:membrane associated rhomboid family serine protease
MAYQSRSFGINFVLTPMVKRLLIANAVVFLITVIVGQQFMFQWFAFQPRQIIFRPWGPFTYMFLHGGMMHLVMNMVVLFFFGPPLESRWGGTEFLRFFVISGLGGVALSFIFLPTGSIVGASAATYGVMLAFAMNWPNTPIYIWGIIPVPAKYLVGFLSVLSLLSAVDGAQGSGIAHFAHLGGLVTAFLYLKADWRPSKKLGEIRRAATKKRRLAIVPRDERDEEHASSSRKELREDAALFDRVDAVLDKISAEGISSLTPAELALLDRVSKKHRTN